MTIPALQQRVMTCIDVTRFRPPGSADVTGRDAPRRPRAAGAALDDASDGPHRVRR
jgi:hypothetical protein